MSTATLHIEKKKTLVPKLRFKEFGGEWNEIKLGDIGKIKMCKRVFNHETSESAEIPFYKIGTFGKIADAFITKEHYLDYKKRFSFPKTGDILLSAAGTLGRTVVYDGSPSYFQDSNIVWIANDEETTTNSFLYYVYQIVRYDSEGGTIQRLYNSIINNTKFYNPKLPEQQKIASFLSAVDEKIHQLSRKKELVEQYKKGVMQQLFSGVLRFKDENGHNYPDWKEKKLGEVADVSKLAGYEFTKHIIYEDEGEIIALRGLNIKNNKLYLKDVKYIDNSELSKLSRSKLYINDLMFTYVGTIGEVALIEENDKYYLAPNVSRIRVNTKFVLPQYVLQYFNLSKFRNNEIEKFISSSSQPALSMENIRKFKIPIPVSEEQQKIANFLSGIDAKIENVGQEINKMQGFKKGLLQQMFV